MCLKKSNRKLLRGHTLRLHLSHSSVSQSEALFSWWPNSWSAPWCMEFHSRHSNLNLLSSKDTQDRGCYFSRLCTSAICKAFLWPLNTLLAHHNPESSDEYWSPHFAHEEMRLHKLKSCFKGPILEINSSAPKFLLIYCR